MSARRGYYFLLSGGNAEQVNLTEPVAAVAVEGAVEDERGTAYAEEEEVREEEDEDTKPICMPYKTYLRCFDEAGSKVLDDKYPEEVPNHNYFRQLVLAKARSLKSDAHWLQTLKDKGPLTHEAQTKCYAVMRWQNLYAHYRDEERCTSFFASIFRLPDAARGEVYSFYVREENCRKQSMSTMNTLTNFESLHSELMNIESAVSERSSSTAGRK